MELILDKIMNDFQRFGSNRETLITILIGLVDLNKLSEEKADEFRNLPVEESGENLFQAFCRLLRSESSDLLEKYYPNFLYEANENEKAIELKKTLYGLKEDLIQMEGTKILNQTPESGAFGKVYIGYRDRLIAVKISQQNSDEIKKVMENEIATLKKIDRHENVVQIFDSGQDNFHMYFTMEYVSGTSIDKFTENIRDLQAILRLGTQAWAGLAHLHSHKPEKICHLDIKPGNVLVNVKKVVKICDFGLAKTRATLKTTESKYQRGTPNYNPPELYFGEEYEVGGTRNLEKSDVWSMGVTLFCCYYDGRSPFNGEKSFPSFERICGIFNEKPKPDISKLAIVKKYERKHPGLASISLSPLKWDREKRESASILVQKTQHLLENISVSQNSVTGILKNDRSNRIIFGTRSSIGFVDGQKIKVFNFCVRSGEMKETSTIVCEDYDGGFRDGFIIDEENTLFALGINVESCWIKIYSLSTPKYFQDKILNQSEMANYFGHKLPTGGFIVSSEDSGTLYAVLNSSGPIKALLFRITKTNADYNCESVFKFTSEIHCLLCPERRFGEKFNTIIAGTTGKIILLKDNNGSQVEALKFIDVNISHKGYLAADLASNHCFVYSPTGRSLNRSVVCEPRFYTICLQTNIATKLGGKEPTAIGMMNNCFVGVYAKEESKLEICYNDPNFST